ncbi:Calcium-activated chloride channel regulator 3A-1 [Anabarilius grahami]|uniref:Calcium-activated chloride channel regulator 3A-1 n=1 Tax=Anabarilius grahami TaxID=495550 RepID=A0A3N0YDY5_ANAGA|nr:Calcium-activated chloride channel regulator 3A-1 [Anabarilius grahami]
MTIRGIPIEFKLDTGADANVLPLEQIRKLPGDVILKPTETMLVAYGGARIKPAEQRPEPRSYNIVTGSGQTYRRNRRHLRASKDTSLPGVVEVVEGDDTERLEVQNMVVSVAASSIESVVVTLDEPEAQNAMDSRTVLVLLWMLLSSSTTGIKLDGNGYVDVTIAIGSKVPQDNTLIDKIKNMFTEGSIYLHQALEKKVYFKEATILVPPHWNGEGFDKASTESYEKAKIRIDNADSDEPYAHQYAECGDEAQYIHFTPNYLLNDSVIQLYGPRGKVLVHEWAHLRWGVYDEYSETKPFYHSNGRPAATRCSSFIDGLLYQRSADGSLRQCNIDQQTFLPTKECMFFPNKIQYTDSSIMFMPSLDSGSRILRQQQAATHLLRNIIEDQASVGIVTFSDNANTLSPLTTIYNESTREKLIKLLPNQASGYTYVCKGLDLGLEPGDWKYSIQTTINQSLTITVTSHAASADVPPIIVKARMSQQFSDGTKPMIVFAEVSQNYRPVINAEVRAYLESQSGSPQELQLLDNGAGADAFKDDGVYSRYFTKFENGRISLKVRVKNQDGQARFSFPKRTGAPYIPGYVVNGVVELNPPKPPVSEEPLEVGSFTRTAIGESFEVAFTGSTPPNFPPNRITDLSAEIQEDSVFLSWTAPGEDLDQGTAKSYEIRWSYDLQMLRESFSNGHVVNTAAVSPQKAGSVEQHSFNLTMDSRTVFVLLWMLLSSSIGIKLDGNGYVDVTIAISSRVPQDNTLIDKIKDMVTKGSIHLHQALDKKVYFKEATILVPPHWNSKEFTKARAESYEKANIRIDNANPAYGDEPYTLQYDECGAEAQFIHFTPNFLQDDTLIKTYGSRGKVLVHEWAHLRWGVYDEYSETNPFYYSNGHIEATRCSKNIEGQYYDESRQPCQTDPQTLLPTKGCKFFPNKYQNTDSSIMFLPSLDSVSTFCHENEHNYEAPNLQNKKCGKATRTVIFEDSVDKDALRSLKPLLSSPPVPTFKVVQRMHRVVCLVLDVSGSMKGPRMRRLQQAATHFLQNIIEDQASVGIVTFSTDAKTLSPLTTIDSESTREKLIKLLPKVAEGWTYICKGLNLGLQVLTKDNGDVIGDEIIFLTDGEATDNINSCVPAAIKSGAIIHTIALGDKADKALREMADKTDSMGKKTSDWFNGTILVDQTIGTKTSFTITYETSLPDISIQSPSGLTYKQVQMRHDEAAKTVTLKVSGTAQPGDWKYSIQTKISQSLTITATSQAARADVPPIVVKARMNQQFSDGTKPMIVFAEVSQNYRPVINAEVWAYLESESGSAQELQLLDNGAGVVELNPQKPPVSEEPLEVGRFTRTATGESFEVAFTGSTPPNFPPNKITDLSAEIQEDSVLLNWTAPGEDLDYGTAKSYEIRWSFDLKELRFNFSNAHVFNTAAVSPLEAGSVEQHSFNPNITIQNGTTVFFAVQSVDKKSVKSEISNIAQASKMLPGPETC